MIRVLHCIETIATGGVEQIRLTLVRGLPKENFTHKIICTWKGGAVADALEDEGVELIPIGGFKHPLEWQKHKEVLRIIKDYKPHIIHGAIFEGMSMAAIGGFFGKVPIVILEETSFPSTRSKKAVFLQRQFIKSSDVIIGIAPTVVKYLKKVVKVPDSKLRLVNNGVNIPREVNPVELDELRGELGIVKGDLVIGSSGRLYNEVKRFTDILEAIYLIGDPRIKLLLLGQGEDKKLINQKAKDLRIENQLIMPGFRSDTAPYYQLMDVFCIVSSHEGFGLVAAEAMMHGLPVIATKVGGLQDIVVEGETGFLVPPNSPDFIAEKTDLLIQSKELRNELGENGRQRALQNFSADIYCKEVKSLYLDLVDMKRLTINNL